MRIQKCFSVILFFILKIFSSYGQDKLHLIYFKDKLNSPYSIDKPSEFMSEKAIKRRQKQNISIQFRDLPVNPSYIQKVRDAGAEILYPTRWFNGVLIKTDEVTLSKIQKLEIIKNTTLLSKSIKIDNQPLESGFDMDRFKNIPRQGRLEAEDYGASLAQIQLLGLDKMHEKGFHGEGITIAVLDNGFQNVDINPAFAHLDVLGTYDFVGRQKNVFGGGTHGAYVLSVLGAYKPNELIGGAYAASYYLFETEDNSSESRAEEVFWLVAAEKADSLGVDIISTSLGYYTFDDPSANYSPKDTDGNTALITRAADMAVGTGMLVVTSAGNVDQSAWKTITFPADGDSVLAVGSVDRNGTHYHTSATGYSSDGRVKPDVMAIGHNTVVMSSSGFKSERTGTSFACPLVSALAAGIWQAHPELTAMEVVRLIQKSGSQYRSPDQKMGYGIPSFERTEKLILGVDESSELTNSDHRNVHIYPNPTQNTLHLGFSHFYQNKELKLTLRNTKGQNVYAKNVFLHKNYFEIQLSDTFFAKGIYLLSIQVGDFTKLLRIVKQ